MRHNPDPLKKRGRSIPTFLKKTYQILQDPINHKVIRWAHDGIGFVVLDQQSFSKTILPVYFKHSNYSSFVRQLNMYNFHKIREVENENYFRHEMFNRNDISAIEEIKRKPERKKKKMEYQQEEESETPEVRRQRSVRKKPQVVIGQSQQQRNEDTIGKIYLEDDNIRVSEETTKGSAKGKTGSESKVHEDELSIENDMNEVRVDQPKLHMFDCGGGSTVIFPLQTGLISIYSLASMMK